MKINLIGILSLMFLNESGANVLGNPCVSKTTCHECIQTPSCGWCIQFERETRYQVRCFQNSSSNHDCLEEYTYRPFNQLTLVQEFTSSTEVQGDTRIVKLKLRRHEPYYVFSMIYTTASGRQSPSEVTDETTDIIIKHDTTCLDGTCQNMEYKILVEIKECPTDPSEWERWIRLIVGQRVLLIDLEMICACPCDHPRRTFYEENSPRCSGHGKYKCGICECDNSHFGNRCQCSTNSGSFENHSCRAPGSEDESFECSGKGVCICNQCECDIRENVNEVITGDFCECDNFSCNRYGGEICGGHGNCICGKCECSPSWSGEACECSNATNTCSQPDSNELCIHWPLW